MRLYHIVDAKDHPLEIEISENLRDGIVRLHYLSSHYKVNGSGYPQYRWSLNNFHRDDSNLINQLVN
jgi:hypothetical protein